MNSFFHFIFSQSVFKLEVCIFFNLEHCRPGLHFFFDKLFV